MTQINPSTEREESGIEYDPISIQRKWQAWWSDRDLFEVHRGDGGRSPQKYVLGMFPYPSGEMHMGHAENYCYVDAVARFWRHQGYQVLNPIGWDSFGLPAENAAIKRGVDPREWTYSNIEQQRRNLRDFGVSYDWSRTIHTSDPAYYKWSQWLFLLMLERGLAYRANSPVNWCPVDQTVLANEQVIDGRCERCGAQVERKKLTQWFFRITDYADRLLDDLNELEGQWPEKVIQMQRNWIGRARGAEIDFEVAGGAASISVFTTRAETLFGATFLAVAPESDLATDLVRQNADASAALDQYRRSVEGRTDRERQNASSAKTGVDLQRFAVNPVNGEQIPIWAADYVLADYGPGAVMGVPAHDERDRSFAERYGLATRFVLERRSEDAPCTREGDPLDPQLTTATGQESEALYVINSRGYDGLRALDARLRIVDDLETSGLGRRSTKYRLRDWLISRQRYWGTPIPVLHGLTGEISPVPLDELPVVLPDASGLNLAPMGHSPLGAATEWAEYRDSATGAVWTRDADTMDTFVDSSWYYLRFLDPSNQNQPFSSESLAGWAPVDVYIGGVEHAILHLLYARFVTKVLKDAGYVQFSEPFTSLVNQGMVTLDGTKMSKSKGNLVEFSSSMLNPGADAIRVAIAFAGPVEDDIAWENVSTVGAQKFLARAWRLSADVGGAGLDRPDSSDAALARQTHRLLRDAPHLMKRSKLNVMVARLMELVNAARKALDEAHGRVHGSVREAAETVAMMLDVVAPHTAEEMWANLGHEPSVSFVRWPEAKDELFTEPTATAAVQVDGKLRASLQVPPSISAADLEGLAREDERVVRALGGANISRVIVKEPRVVSFITQRD